MKKKSASNTIYNVIIVILVLVIGYILFVNLTTKDKNRISYFGYRPAIILTGSMEPKFMRNGVILVKSANFTDIKKGDTVSFVQDGKLISHKVIEVNSNSLQTKGLNNQTADEFKVTPDMVVGKVVAHTNATAVAVVMFSKPINILLAVVFVLSIIAFFYLLRKLVTKGQPEEQVEL